MTAINKLKVKTDFKELALSKPEEFGKIDLFSVMFGIAVSLKKEVQSDCFRTKIIDWSFNELEDDSLEFTVKYKVNE